MTCQSRMTCVFYLLAGMKTHFEARSFRFRRPLGNMHEPVQLSPKWTCLLKAHRMRTSVSVTTPCLYRNADASILNAALNLVRQHQMMLLTRMQPKQA